MTRLVRCSKNVEVIQQDAAQLDVAGSVDAVLFSLSYFRDPLSHGRYPRAWDLVAPGGRLVIMDAGITESHVQPMLAPITRPLLKLAPGAPVLDTMVDLAELGPVSVERFLFNVYFVCSVTNPAAS